MPSFNVEDKVRWVRAVGRPEYKDVVGTVLDVIPSDTNLEKFNMYHVEFDFGRFTLYGTQIAPE
jgi:hypothetical protein